MTGPPHAQVLPVGWPAPVPARVRVWPYAFGLVVLAPFLAETVASANTPAVLFPIVLPLFAVVYGCPALLVRELWVRGRLGPVRMVLVGVAYTAFNEGLVAATWFKLSPDDAHVLAFSAAQAGRAGGVNWAVAAGLVVFHLVFSLVLPVTVAQGVAVARRSPAAGLPWLRRPGRWVCLVLPALVVLGSLTPDGTRRTCAGPALTACTAGRVWSVVMIAAVVVVVLLGWTWGRPRARVRRSTVWSAPWLIGAGVLFSVAFFVAFFGLPLAGVPVAAVTVDVLLLLVVAVVVRRWCRAEPADLPSFAVLAVGLLVPGVLLSVRGLVVGQPVAAALGLALVVWVARRLWRSSGALGGPLRS